MRRNRQQKGFSLIELLIVIAIILIIVTVALPKLNKARMYAQETAALKAIQTLNTAQVQYQSQFSRFAQNLTELGPPASGTDNASSANLISSDMAAGAKQGYNFTLTGTPTGYTITAVPQVFGSTGSRTFWSFARTMARSRLPPTARKSGPSRRRPATPRSRPGGGAP
jgi:prepilin-type N-terminal cleavage/methylation domain-containing protein